MKKAIFKFIVSKPRFEYSLHRDLDAIRRMLGDFEVVKVKYHWWLPCDMVLWCVKKDTEDKQ